MVVCRRSQPEFRFRIPPCPVLRNISPQLRTVSRGVSWFDDNRSVQAHLDLQVFLRPTVKGVRARCMRNQRVGDCRTVRNCFLRQNSRHAAGDAHQLESGKQNRSITHSRRQMVGQCHRELNILCDNQCGARNLHGGAKKRPWCKVRTSGPNPKRTHSPRSKSRHRPAARCSLELRLD